MSERLSTPLGTTRRIEIDALRGLAVVLMVEQHLGVWLWQRPQSRADVSTGFVAFNALGGLAAPLFLLLAGIGCAFLAASARPGTDRTFAARGGVLLALGYALNIATPSWFSWGSWYVLHLLGVASLLAPLARRMSSAWVVAILVAIVAATPLVQWWLHTPDTLLNGRMRDMSLAGGPLRMALAEGQFPVLPWLSVYLAGIVAGRLLLAKRLGRLALFAASCLIAGGALAAAYEGGVDGPAGGLVHAVFRMRPGFYPASPAIVLLLSGIALFLVWGASHLSRTGVPGAIAWVSGLGRISLSVLLVHVVAFRELTRPIGLWRAMSAIGTVATMAVFLSLCALVSRIWARSGYRYGAEWVVRTVSRACEPRR